MKKPIAALLLSMVSATAMAQIALAALIGANLLGCTNVPNTGPSSPTPYKGDAVWNIARVGHSLDRCVLDRWIA